VQTFIVIFLARQKTFKIKIPFHYYLKCFVTFVANYVVKWESNSFLRKTKFQDQHHHHHQLVGRRHIHESEYEEIGPPPQKNNNNSSINNNNNSFHTNGHVNNNNGTTTRTPCDLCGTASAMVKCHLCSDQVFCLACDDMYHRHPKRSTHPRKVNDVRLALKSLSKSLKLFPKDC